MLHGLKNFLLIWRKRKERRYMSGENDFNKDKKNVLFNLKVQKDGSKFKRLLKKLEYQKIVDLLTTKKGKWKRTKKTFYESISRGDLTKETKVWFYFISSVLLPLKHC